MNLISSYVHQILNKRTFAAGGIYSLAPSIRSCKQKQRNPLIDPREAPGGSKQGFHKEIIVFRSFQKLRFSTKSALDARVHYFQLKNKILHQYLRIYSNSEVYCIGLRWSERAPFVGWRQLTKGGGG